MDITKEIYERSKAGQSFVLSTIVQTKGASPRKPGAKMLILPDGSIVGTIGGGTFEKQVIEDALKLLKSNTQYQLKNYGFSSTGKNAIGMTCGGEATVFMELNLSPDNLFIFGGGHICRELTRLAVGSGFITTVIDDRKDILDYYDSSVNTILTDAKYKKNFPEVGERSYIVVVTKNHKSDQPVMEQVINKNCAYIGMIGSKAKAKKVLLDLEKSGVSKKILKNVHSPIGLDIGSEGPYEIAISIMAEIIEAKHQLSKK